MKEAEIEDFLEGFNQPTYRGMRVNGVRVANLVVRPRFAVLARGDRLVGLIYPLGQKPMLIILSPGGPLNL
jgi:hypothetical protein